MTESSTVLPKIYNNSSVLRVLHKHLAPKGLRDSQLKLLSTYLTYDFPDLYELSELMNISENALVKRFSRIEKQLALKNKAALIKMLTIFSQSNQ